MRMKPARVVGPIASLFGFSLALAADSNGKPPPQVQDIYKPSDWTVVKSVSANFGKTLPRAQVMLLKSVQATGSSGVGSSLYAVNVIVAAAGKIVYTFFPPGVPTYDDHQTDPVFQVDDVLDLRDLTGDRVAEIVFHSGFLGASDQRVDVHVLQFMKDGPMRFRDIRADGFTESWWTGVRFLDCDGQAFAAVAQPVDPPVSPGDFVSHGQPRFHKYLVYGWRRKTGRFEVLQTIPHTKYLHADAEAGFDADWSYIVSAVSKQRH